MIQNGALFKGHILFRNGHNIGTQGNICRLHVHTNAQCLQRGTSGIIFSRIIAHNSQICCITARLHAIRNGMYHGNFRFQCQFIHHRRIGIFQRRLAAKHGNGLICHAISQNNNIFHWVSPLVQIKSCWHPSCFCMGCTSSLSTVL